MKRLAESCCFLGIDFEGAGQFAGDGEEPVQIGLCLLKADGQLPEEGRFVSYLRPRGVISPAAQRVHGIRVEEVSSAPSLPELWPELQPRFEQGILCAYGKATERRYLERLPGYNLEPFIDVLPLMRSAFPSWPEHGLGYCVERLQLTRELREFLPQREFHDALFDATATVLLLRFLLQNWSAQEITLSDLLNPSLSQYYAMRAKLRS